MLRIGSLFSGAGGLDMAVEAVFGGEVVWHSEIDEAASKVLAHHWPEVPNLGDISAVGWHTVPTVDILCGGFPCQDVSAAGKRAGIKDGTRSGLWSVFADAIETLRPPIVIIENVRGLLSAKAHRNLESDQSTMGEGSSGSVLRAAGAVLGDLADLRYDAQWATVSAASVGAPHRRERVFIIATQSGGAAIRLNTRGTFGAQAGAQSGNRPGDYRGKQSNAVDLLPTPRSSDCFGAGLHGEGGMDLRTTVSLLPTPAAQDGNGGGRYSSPGHQSTLPGEARLLCTPSASDGAGGKTSRSGSRISEPPLGGQAREMQSGWGKYAPAIERWESLNRPAPPPTEPNKNGKPRLLAQFSEWMMGWPEGHVTDPAIGLSRNDQLRIIGNGVCQQQAAAALNQLLAIATDTHTHTHTACV